MLSRIKQLLPSTVRLYAKKVVNKIKAALEKRKEKKTIDLFHATHKIAIQKLRSKDSINCVFLAVSDAAWKYDTIYKRLEQYPRFNLSVLVCPIVNYGYENMIVRMDKCYHTLKEKGYNILKAYNIETKEYLDIRKDLNADILFYTNPYKGLIDDRYYITQFPDILSVYVPYHFSNNNDYNSFNNLLFHNLLWRIYVETEWHKRIYCEHQRLKGKNVIATGYPGIEPILLKVKEEGTIFQWKNKNNKKIIWAPHHTIHPVRNVNYSCFMKYAYFMLEMANKYKDCIDIAFKPHPLLRIKLYKEWGREKTEEYYNLWETMPNTMLQDGEYSDLFLSSDAMIHDSGSFLIEYLYTQKPVMRTMNNIAPESMYNDFALDALNVYYKAYNELDIERFIQSVIEGNDPLKEKRKEFYKERLLPPNGELPSQNIVNDIIENIER